MLHFLVGQQDAPTTRISWEQFFFSVEDNGEPGRNADRISEVFFTTGNPDPQICEDFPSGFFPTFPIESGNISIRD